MSQANITKHIVTIRSKTTFGIDTVVIDVHPDQQVEKIAETVAASYGANVEMIVPLPSPLESLKECLGFVEAWQCHLEDTGADRAAATVKEVLNRARLSYQYATPQVNGAVDVKTEIAEVVGVLEGHPDAQRGNAKVHFALMRLQSLLGKI